MSNEPVAEPAEPVVLCEHRCILDNQHVGRGESHFYGYAIGYPDERDLVDRMVVAPPIVQAAIVAIFDHEDHIDEMGYDIAYYQTDLPRLVVEAIKPWAESGGTPPMTKENDE